MTGGPETDKTYVRVAKLGEGFCRIHAERTRLLSYLSLDNHVLNLHQFGRGGRIVAFC